MTTDVLIVGAGPIGLITAIQLSKTGCSVTIIDQEDKLSQPVYGRACTILPRTLEMWDQLGLLSDLLNVGTITKTGHNFRNGEAVSGGLSFLHRMDKHGDTVFNFALHLRQRVIEQIFEKRLNKLGVFVKYQTKLVSYIDHTVATSTVNQNGIGKEAPVTARVFDAATSKTSHIQAQYIIGADGGKSSVRKMSGIKFNGNRSAAKWIRMDALVKTDMPSSRSLNSIQSEHHGLILFCPIEGNRTRIGYVFSEDIRKKWGVGEDGEGVTEEIVIAEAKEALRPFTIEFEKVDWFTIYGIGQRMAENFVHGRTILVGDACHTHSSGSAQGLNTGSHDSINLAWKLSLVLRGLAPHRLLDTYNTERKSVVQKVIANDSVVASLISGEYPEKYAGRKESTRDILTEWFANQENLAFTLGLGVSYVGDDGVQVKTKGYPLSTIVPGERGPDAHLSRIGTGEHLRLHSVINNQNVFNIVVFTGEPAQTRPTLSKLSDGLTSPGSITLTPNFGALCSLHTIILGYTASAMDTLGCIPFGSTYLDSLGAAHDAYGVDPSKGAIVVFRPDGYVGTILGLSEGAEGLKDYLARIVYL